MTAQGRVLSRLRPDPTELLSFAERSRYLLALRVGLAVVAVSVVIAHGAGPRPPIGAIVAGAIGYVVLALAPAVLRDRSAAVAVKVIGAMLLLDGIFLSTGIAMTGAAASPLRFLLFLHVIGVILICSYRTGLKVTLWHSLLFLLVVEGRRTGILDLAPGGGADASSLRVAVLTVAGLWVIALGTATFAALSERELRRQKVDLERLSAMAASIEAASDSDDIPRIMLEELSTTFGIRRGLILVAPHGELTLVASTEDDRGSTGPIGIDPLVDRAWSTRTSLAVREIDPVTDPNLAELLPEAENVLLVPLIGGQIRHLGIVLLEPRGASAGIRRWVLAMIEQFTSHAALALNNAWLSEDREAKLIEIGELRDELQAYSADLEIKVAERTQELRATILELKEIDRQRRRLLDHVVRASEEERQRIANDVHDDPVQKMIAVKMRLELLAKKHPGLEEVPAALEVVRGSIGSLRHLLFDLRPPILDEAGLAPAIRTLLENSEADFTWSVTDELEIQPSQQTRLILYRIAQEALANARKHSQADHVRVWIGESEGEVAMEIADDGVGFEPHQAVLGVAGHMGLAAMRERAEMSGGRCELHSLPGEGTTLNVWMPMIEDISSSDGHADDIELEIRSA
jgi:signal transduction histidine kinase